MFNVQESAIRYKWDHKTSTGFRLTYNDQYARQGLHGCFHVEDWDHHQVVDAWGCDSLEEALLVLNHFFDIDLGKETDLVKRCFATRI